MKPRGEEPGDVGKTSAPNTSCVQNTNEERQHAGSLSKHPFHSFTFPLTKAQTASLTGGKLNRMLYFKAACYTPAVGKK